MSAMTAGSVRGRELGAIIRAYSEVTERLKGSHEQLREQVQRLREELARTNRQLRRRERLAALGQMAAGLAHEIRNPLGGIQMFASLLKRDVADRPDAVRLVERITQGVSSLESIVTDVLEFSRPAEPESRRVLLAEVAREAAELAAGHDGGSGARVEVAPELEHLEITTDPALLGRALLNLALNGIQAAEAAGRSPRVVIGARRAGSNVVLTVTDNGLGVPAAMLDRIFDPFFTTRARGTGLGLAIVHQILELLGGSIRVANRAGGGAEFLITLPRVWSGAKLDDDGKRQAAHHSRGRSSRGCAMLQEVC